MKNRWKTSSSIGIYSYIVYLLVSPKGSSVVFDVLGRWTHTRMKTSKLQSTCAASLVTREDFISHR